MSRTLDDIRGRCRIVDDHWLWSGAMSEGYPRIYAPDYTLHNGALKTQHGRRAVWHLIHKKPIPKGWRIFATCDEASCVIHAACKPTAVHGREIKKSGKWKGNVRRIVAVRAVARKRSQVTAEIAQLIMTSPKSGEALSRELGIGRSIISRYRTGKPTAFTPVGGLFTGLLLAGAS